MTQNAPYGLSYPLMVSDGSTITLNVTEVVFSGAAVANNGNTGPAEAEKAK